MHLADGERGLCGIMGLHFASCMADNLTKLTLIASFFSGIASLDLQVNVCSNIGLFLKRVQ